MGDVLYLVHHADAVDATLDAQRPLSAAGHQHAASLAARAGARGVKPDVIWHSGKLRARQTAEHMLRVANPLAEYAAARGLQPTDPPEWIRDVVNVDPRSIMLVGHMPHLGRLLNLLVAGTVDGALTFPLHGLVGLERGERLWSETMRM